MSSVEQLTGESIRGLGPGAYLVSALPSAVLVLSLLALTSSRLYPWSEPIQTGKGEPVPAGLPSIVYSAHKLGLAGIVVVSLLVVLVAVLARPLQLAAIQLLEGYGGGRGAGFIEALGVERHARRYGINAARRQMWVKLRPSTTAFAEVADYSRRVRRVKRMAERAERIISDYPDRLEVLLPTLLGNILRRMETNAGERYGLDTIVTYPRLYPYISPRLEGEIAVQLDALSSTATFVFVFLAQALAAAPLVVRLDGWSLLPVIFAFAAAVSNRGSRAAGRRYAELIATAYDLHRFDMLQAMRRNLPETAKQEQAQNEQLSKFLLGHPPGYEMERRVGIVRSRYNHRSPLTETTQGASTTGQS